ncbi:MAG: hypothetical protein LBB94_02300 [Clostridiales bacterium]|nr:hypothetical protein [Clostridiales bacterium]
MERLLSRISGFDSVIIFGAPDIFPAVQTPGNSAQNKCFAISVHKKRRHN